MKVEMRLNTGRNFVANVPKKFTDEEIIAYVNSELEKWGESVEEILSKKEVKYKKKPKVVKCTDMTYSRAKRLFDKMSATILKTNAIVLTEEYRPTFEVMCKKINEALDNMADSTEERKEV